MLLQAKFLGFYSESTTSIALGRDNILQNWMCSTHFNRFLNCLRGRKQDLFKISLHLDIMPDETISRQFVARCLKNGALPVWTRRINLNSLGSSGKDVVTLSIFVVGDTANLVVMRHLHRSLDLYSAAITDDFVKEAQARNENAASLNDFVAAFIDGLLCDCGAPPPELSAASSGEGTLDLLVAQEFFKETGTWAQFAYALRRSSTTTNALEIALLEAQSRGKSLLLIILTAARESRAERMIRCLRILFPFV